MSILEQQIQDLEVEKEQFEVSSSWDLTDGNDCCEDPSINSLTKFARNPTIVNLKQLNANILALRTKRLSCHLKLSDYKIQAERIERATLCDVCSATNENGKTMYSNEALRTAAQANMLEADIEYQSIKVAISNINNELAEINDKMEYYEKSFTIRLTEERRIIAELYVMADTEISRK